MINTIFFVRDKAQSSCNYRTSARHSHAHELPSAIFLTFASPILVFSITVKYMIIVISLLPSLLLILFLSSTLTAFLYLYFYNNNKLTMTKIMMKQ